MQVYVLVVVGVRFVGLVVFVGVGVLVVGVVVVVAAVVSVVAAAVVVVVGAVVVQRNRSLQKQHFRLLEKSLQPSIIEGCGDKI